MRIKVEGHAIKFIHNSRCKDIFHNCNSFTRSYLAQRYPIMQKDSVCLILRSLSYLKIANLSLWKGPWEIAVAMTSYSHIAKGKRQCVDGRVDLPEELLPVVLVHLLEVHACQKLPERRDWVSARSRRRHPAMAPLILWGWLTIPRAMSKREGT